MLWSSANPASVIDSGIDSLISEQKYVKRLAQLQLPCGILKLRSIGLEYLPFMLTLNNHGLR